MYPSDPSDKRPLTLRQPGLVSRLLVDRAMRHLLSLVALASLATIFLIALFVFRESLTAFANVGLLDFLLGPIWRPGLGQFGIAAMLVSSVYVVLGTMVAGVPLALATAVLLAEVAPPPARAVLRPAVELLAGIPSVVFGFLGLLLIVPVVRVLGGSGYSVLTGIVVLSIMILPTVVSIAEDAIRAVPLDYKEGSLALGATHWQTIHLVLLPAARSGLVAAVILGMGRALGETMAMVMVLGNAIAFPISPLDSARTVTTNIAVGITEASGLHRSALFATGVVLFVLIAILNSMAHFGTRRR